MQKNTSKTAIFVCTNLSYLTLEGPGRQTVDTRSTAGVALKTLGNTASNLLSGRSVAPKLSAHEPATFFYCGDTKIREKSVFLGKHAVPENFQRENFLGLLPTESLRTQDSENVVGLGD